MEKIVFATNNTHKLGELRQMLAGFYEVLSLRDIGCNDDIPETADTFEGNALLKASWVKEHYGYDCFADDSGLEVDALGGAPGVMSARYAGKHGDDSANNLKLLNELNGKSSRKARFRCAIALVTNDEEPRFFSGVIEGSITNSPEGTSGFGYDPLFIPDGMNRTFAQLSAEEKNAISHRGKAVVLLAKYLERHNTKTS